MLSLKLIPVSKTVYFNSAAFQLPKNVLLVFYSLMRFFDNFVVVKYRFY